MLAPAVNILYTSTAQSSSFADSQLAIVTEGLCVKIQSSTDRCLLCAGRTRLDVDGFYVRSWDVVCCGVCKRANHDGIVRSNYPELDALLASKGILPVGEKYYWPAA